MAGAISAGAYTAGVVDFLIDALDSWYQARSSGGVPLHDVELCVLTGASAGGMTAAISSAALHNDFQPARSPGDTPGNKLHESWVKLIDAENLLSTSDLERDPKCLLRSVLNPSQIELIAERALRIESPVKRDFVADSLRVVLTLTNLQGTPYTVEPKGRGSTETQVAYHADRIQFDIARGNQMAASTVYRLDPGSTDGWDVLRRAAIATGAVPFALPVQALPRRAAEYNERTWFQTPEEPQCIDGKCICEEQVHIPPDWDLKSGQSVTTFNVDGGATNNDPLECALRELADHGEPGPIKRSAEEADRAVISIAPFPSKATFDPAFASPTLATLAGELISVLLRQSRFQGQEVRLMQSLTDFSRFFIAPSLGDDVPGRFALAGGSLGAFGGFVDRRFREYDYQLGRRNCQWFLLKYFWLPETNPVIRAGLERSGDVSSFRELRGDVRWYPIIPLVSPELRRPVVASYQVERNGVEITRPKLDAADVDRLAGRVIDRLNVIAKNLPEVAALSPAVSLFLRIGWLFGKGVLKRRLREWIEGDLRDQELL